MVQQNQPFICLARICAQSLAAQPSALLKFARGGFLLVFFRPHLAIKNALIILASLALLN